MKTPKINLLGSETFDFQRRKRFSFWKGALIGLAALVIILPVLFSLASWRLITAAQSLNPGSQAGEKISLFESVRRLVSNSERQLRGENRDRINILLMGEGGEGHDGPNLTDTMLLVSIKPTDGSVGVLSIPRDLWVTLPGIGQGKINSANALKEHDQPGSGGAYAAETVSQLLDQPVDYYVRVDFSAFKTLVDDVGGVTVNVDNTFTDYAYPTDDNLYQTVHFDKGWQTMNGATALKYSRSRHGNNGEGSDFARSRRQQKLLLALKDKIVSVDTLLNPSRVASILETLRTHVTTDMELWEIVKLAQIGRNIDAGKLVHHVLDDNPEGPLYATTMPVSNGDAYVLLPRRGDWTDVQRIARDIFSKDSTASAPPEQQQALRLEIQNGTTQAGLAQKTRDLLAKVGYEIVRVGNATDQHKDKTVIYDLTNGTQPEALSTLKNLLGAQVALTVPGYLSSGLTPSSLTLTNGEKPVDARADFLVVLGQDAIH